VISQERGGSRPPESGVSEPISATQERTRKAREVSREVVVKAEDVARKATEIYRIVGGSAFTVSALRNRDVVDNLQELEGRIKHFHTAVRAAIDEYLIGNTLIMDLIARHDLATRTIQHALNVAVFATELASQALLKGDLCAAVAGDPDAGGNAVQSADLKRDLAEIFLGGFMHDCGLWNEDPASDEGHEVSGTQLISQIPEIVELLPSLMQIVLFHSDAIRIATKPALVMIIDQADDERKRTFKSEFYRTAEEARTSVGMRA
jgi:hypothetical protein